jgi:hypothetical protein
VTAKVALYRRAPSVLFRKVGKETILASEDGDGFERLSETASRVWSLLDVPRSRAELTRILTASYAAAPSAIRSDVQALLDELAGRRLVHVTYERS